ncbi:taste receptor type 2 member 3 [Fukomys damarensis]|uniref:Taste receptor type 2 n=1 Tax=Fukomys damarensis TaxID=885580 RepID=A0A091DGB2_FUKDA|nr:taste receptor type 2 member 3 [Fukomys damarensis]KFO30107.1 Taste receptor type 2 member 3 [Fukomys damarensis]
MLELAEWVFLVLIVAQFILGNLGNGFIELVNGSSWFKSKRISLSDFVITILALSRIILLWIIFIDGVLIVFFFHLHVSGTLMRIIDIFWTFVNNLNIWFITCLGVLYCLKIANYSHPIFLWLKWRVSKVVVWMLLSALLLSCVRTMSLINEFKLYFSFSGIDSKGNMTEYFREKRHEYDLMHVLGTLWNLPPLVVCLISYFLLLFSLGKHMRQMEQNGINSRDRGTETHKRAIRIILSFLLFFLFYFISFLIFSFSRFVPQRKMSVMIGEVITMLNPAAHSFILILGNKKLKQSFLAMLPCKSGHLHPGSTESFSP